MGSFELDDWVFGDAYSENPEDPELLRGFLDTSLEQPADVVAPAALDAFDCALFGALSNYIDDPAYVAPSDLHNPADIAGGLDAGAREQPLSGQGAADTAADKAGGGKRPSKGLDPLIQDEVHIRFLAGESDAGIVRNTGLSSTTVQSRRGALIEKNPDHAASFRSGCLTPPGFSIPLAGAMNLAEMRKAGASDAELQARLNAESKLAASGWLTRKDGADTNHVRDMAIIERIKNNAINKDILASSDISKSELTTLRSTVRLERICQAIAMGTMTSGRTVTDFAKREIKKLVDEEMPPELIADKLCLSDFVVNEFSRESVATVLPGMRAADGKTFTPEAMQIFHDIVQSLGTGEEAVRKIVDTLGFSRRSVQEKVSRLKETADWPVGMQASSASSQAALIVPAYRPIAPRQQREPGDPASNDLAPPSLPES